MDEDNTITAVRVQLGEMKGMLETSLSNHNSQLQRHESEIGGLQNRSSNIEAEAAGQKELIHSVSRGLDAAKLVHDKDINELKMNQTGQFGKIMLIVGPLLAGLAFVFSLSKDIYLGG